MKRKGASVRGFIRKPKTMYGRIHSSFHAKYYTTIAEATTKQDPSWAERQRTAVIKNTPAPSFRDNAGVHVFIKGRAMTLFPKRRQRR